MLIYRKTNLNSIENFVQNNLITYILKSTPKSTFMDFPGGTVDKNPPANARDTGSIPGPKRTHILWSNSPCTTTTEPML